MIFFFFIQTFQTWSPRLLGLSSVCPRMAKPTEPPKYKHRYTLYAHSMAVTALKFSPDGVYLASACKTYL